MQRLVAASRRGICLRYLQNILAREAVDAGPYGPSRLGSDIKVVTMVAHGLKSEVEAVEV